MSTKRSFVLTVTTAGTAVQGSGSKVPGDYLFQAYAGNNGTHVYIGNDGLGDVASGTGFALTVDGIAVPMTLENGLSDIWVDADTNGDSVIALLLS